MFEIIVFKSPECPKCEKLEEFLDREGVEYDDEWFTTKVHANLIMENNFGNPPILSINGEYHSSEEFFDGVDLREDVVSEMVGIV